MNIISVSNIKWLTSDRLAISCDLKLAGLDRTIIGFQSCRSDSASHVKEIFRMIDSGEVSVDPTPVYSDEQVLENIAALEAKQAQPVATGVTTI